jgi:hypothetical protein
LICRSPVAAIAKQLNAERVAGPGGRPWCDTTIRGQAERGTGLLNNALYVGRLEWNRCSYVKNPHTGKRVARPNPREKWEVTEVPHLRIVDDALWQQVNARQNMLRFEIGREVGGNALNRAPSTSQSLLRPRSSSVVQDRIDRVLGAGESICSQQTRQQRLLTVPGIGPIISSAVVAAIGDGAGFKGVDRRSHGKRHLPQPALRSPPIRCDAIVQSTPVLGKIGNQSNHSR